jgi:hypothetical protein
MGVNDSGRWRWIGSRCVERGQEPERLDRAENMTSEMNPDNVERRSRCIFGHLSAL